MGRVADTNTGSAPSEKSSYGGRAVHLGQLSTGPVPVESVALGLQSLGSSVSGSRWRVSGIG